MADYSLIAASGLSLFLFIYYNSGQIFLFIITAISIIVLAANYWLLKATSNYKRSINILSSVGTLLIISVFGDGGFKDTGYLWIFPFITFIFCVADNINIIIFWISTLTILCFSIVGLHWVGLIQLPYSSSLLLQVFISVSVLVSLSITFRKASDNYEYFLSSAKRLMDVAITPIAVVDPDGKIIHTNKAMIAMTGMSKESLSKTQLSSYFENCKNVDEIIKDIFKNKSVQNIPMVANMANKKINILCTASVSQERDIGQQGLFFLKDVTDLVNAENKVNDYARDLEKQNRELDQFAYIVSHDLKAPLRAISNLSEWIKEDLGTNLPEDSKKNIELLQNRVQRMSALITGILEYSRVGRIKVEQEKVDTNKLLAEIIDTLSPPERFNMNIQPNMPMLKTEKILLQQVFSNLISNAIKYNDKAIGEISVSVKELEVFYEFTVMDNGHGIAPEHQEKVFDIFQTLESKDKTESTGIGLSIVKKIITEHGCTIRIDSEIGKGAKFIFTWPK